MSRIVCVWLGPRAVSFLLYRLIGAKPKGGKVSVALCSVCATYSYLGGLTVLALVFPLIHESNDRIAVSGKTFCSFALCIVCSLTMPGAVGPSRNCTDFGKSDGLILYIARVNEALQLIGPLRVTGIQAVCAFSEPSL